MSSGYNEASNSETESWVIEIASGNAPFATLGNMMADLPPYSGPELIIFWMTEIMNAEQEASPGYLA